MSVPAEADIVISLQNVCKAFGDKQVLNDLSIEVGRGESVVIVGGSGTGKSVTIKHIIGLLRPDRGHVYVEHEDIAHVDRRAEPVPAAFRHGVSGRGALRLHVRLREHRLPAAPPHEDER
jgi:ABC-type transporter Mla maintaining outer membrane lipid asymmetry ATPase subunit MlaF